MRFSLILLFALCACTPSLSSLDQPATTESAQTGSARAVWQAQVSGGGDLAGSYEGELASATVQDAQVLGLELVNRTWRGTARFSDDALSSPPLMIVYRAGGPLGGSASAMFSGEGQPQSDTFTGPAEADFEVVGDVVSGTLTFRGQNPLGLEVVVRADVRVSTQ